MSQSIADFDPQQIPCHAQLVDAGLAGGQIVYKLCVSRGVLHLTVSVPVLYTDCDETRRNKIKLAVQLVLLQLRDPRNRHPAKVIHSINNP